MTGKPADRGPATRAVHDGETVTTARRPAVPPIHQTAPFAFDDTADLVRGFADPSRRELYSRYDNPTVRVLEEKIASLEDADGAVAFSSGMAAMGAVLETNLAAEGSRLLVARELYGGTRAWAEWIGSRRPGIEVASGSALELASTVTEGDRPFDLVVVESPTNPTLRCPDLAELAAACRARGSRLVVDNTFATPVLQQPLAVGADLVVHSATKFIGGHSDVTAGLVAAREADLEPLRHHRLLAGACLDPHAAWLAARGARTLSLRIERQSANAARLAESAASHPAVRRVFYPGSDPVARRQQSSGGAMLSLELASAGAAAACLDAFRIFRILPSLGGLESSAIIPAITSHAGLEPEERLALGITDGLVRLSVGIEDLGDLDADLLGALDRAGAAP